MAWEGLYFSAPRSLKKRGFNADVFILGRAEGIRKSDAANQPDMASGASLRFIIVPHKNGVASFRRAVYEDVSAGALLTMSLKALISKRSKNRLRDLLGPAPKRRFDLDRLFVETLRAAGVSGRRHDLKKMAGEVEAKSLWLLKKGDPTPIVIGSMHDENLFLKTKPYDRHTHFEAAQEHLLSHPALLSEHITFPAGGAKRLKKQLRKALETF